jgi:hypothetical protein
LLRVAEVKGAIARFSTFSHPLSLLIWLGLQLLVLLLPVMQVQLSEDFPRPAEKLAAVEMVVAQIALSALLFPILLQNFATAMVMAATTWPFLLLAGLLSSTPSYRSLEAGAFISIWMIALGALRVDSAKSNAWMSCIVSAIAIGGACAAYLRAEFGSGEISTSFFGPIVSALDVLHGVDDRWRSWMVLPVFLMAAGVLRFVSYRVSTRSRQVMHNFCG